jgi:hypothetical protein
LRIQHVLPVGADLLMSETSEPKVQGPLCTSCKAPMQLVRIVPRLGGMLELHTFECKPCGIVVTRPAEDND